MGLSKKADIYSSGDVKEFSALLLQRVKELAPGLQKNSERLADPFRKDALEMPSRHLEKYAHLNVN